MRPPTEREILAARASRMGSMQRAGFFFLLTCWDFWRQILGVLIILVGLGAWYTSTVLPSGAANFSGTVEQVRLPSEPSSIVGGGNFFFHLLDWGSSPAVVTIRMWDGSEIEWKVEPMAAAYLQPEDVIFKESGRKPAVFRNGKQMRVGSMAPFRTDEVPLPTAATALQD